MSSGHSSAGDGVSRGTAGERRAPAEGHLVSIFIGPSCSWEPHPAQLNLTWQEHCGRSEVSLPLNQSRGLMTIFWELLDNRQTEIQVKPKAERKDTDVHDGWGFCDGVRPEFSCCFCSTNKQFWSFFPRRGNQTSIPAKTSVSDPATIPPSVQIITNMLRRGT